MKNKLLLIGRHESIMQRVMETLNNNGYDVTGTSKHEAIQELFVKHQPNLVVIGGGVELNDRVSIKEKLREIKPEILFVEHFGGITSLMDEIKWAID